MSVLPPYDLPGYVSLSKDREHDSPDPVTLQTPRYQHVVFAETDIFLNFQLWLKLFYRLWLRRLYDDWPWFRFWFHSLPIKFCSDGPIVLLPVGYRKFSTRYRRASRSVFVCFKSPFQLSALHTFLTLLSCIHPISLSKYLTA